MSSHRTRQPVMFPLLAALIVGAVSWGHAQAAAVDAFNVPRGGEIYLIGSQLRVRVLKGAMKKDILIELSRDGGASFVAVGTIPGTTKAAPKEFLFDFTVSGPPTSTAVLRASSRGSKGPISVLSNPFAITASNLSAGIMTLELADKSVTAPKINSESSLVNTVLTADGSGGASFLPNPADGSIFNVHVNPAAAIDLTKLSKAGAAPGDVITYDGADLVYRNVPASGITIPFAGTFASAATLFSLTDSGTGAVGGFAITNASNTANALTGTTNGAGAAVCGISTGNGNAGKFSITNAASTSATVAVSSTGIGSGITVQLTNASNGARGLDVTQAGVGPGVFATSAGGNAVWGITSSVSAAGVIGDNTNGEAVVGRTRGLGASSNYASGVGAVVGRNDGPGYGVRGFVAGTLSSDPTPPSSYESIGVFGQAGVSGNKGIGGRFENTNAANLSDVLQAVTTTSATNNLFVAKKGTANVARIDSTGKGFFNGGTQASGADVAELIPTTGAQPRPGDVVEIDPENAMHYRLCSSPASTMVAGVITTKPAVLMNKAVDDEEYAPALALVGRVPVKITNEGGAVKIGDMLVSSSTPGHAMRAPKDVKPGTVLGKALQAFSGEKGSIEILVMTR